LDQDIRRQPFSKKNPTQQQQFLEKMASAMTTIAFMLLSAVATNAANLRSPTTASGSSCSQCLAAISANGTFTCGTGWTFWGQSCYQRQTSTPTGDWRIARNKCRSLGAYTSQWSCSAVCGHPHLAVPNTLAENTFLTTTMNPGSKSYSWIGFDYLKAKPANMARVYEDGSPVTSITWRNVYHVGTWTNSEPALFMRDTGGWSFDPYTGLPSSTQYVCEVPVRFVR